MSDSEDDGDLYHDEIEIEDFEFDEEKQMYFYPCPCGDLLVFFNGRKTSDFLSPLQ